MKKFLPHILVIVGFIAMSFVYFSPVIDGKVLYMGDIVNLEGAYQDLQEFRAEYDEEPLWVENVFSGMPAYLIGSRNPGNVVYNTVRGIVDIIPRPAVFLFLLSTCFYLLLIGLKFEWKMAALGAVGFAFSSYFFQIMEAGHTSKTYAIAVFPLIALGVIKTFRNNLLIGGVIFAIAMTMEIGWNHLQMTYYFGIFLGIYTIYHLIESIRQKKVASFAKQVAVLAAGVIIAAAINAGKLWPIYDYSKDSTRGKSELTIDDVQGTNKTGGLDKDYITQWSYGVTESINFLIPNFMGGATTEDIGEESNLYRSLQGRAPNARQIVSNVPTYWGDQPFVSGPYYMGAIMLFLFFLGAWILPRKQKLWILIGTVLILMLSWGKNFMPLTEFFIDYVPLYDKFRAVASILTVAMFAVPFLGIMGYRAFMNEELDKAQLKKGLIAAFSITGGLSLIIALIGPSLFDFAGQNDQMFADAGLLDPLMEDRKDMMRADAFRSFAFIAIAAGLMFLGMNGKMKKAYITPILIVLVVADMWTVDKRYLNDDNFVRKNKMEQPFQPTQADLQVMNDKELGYRVYDTSERLDQSSRSMFFHNSVGGYHAAKLKRYQEMISMHMNRGNQDVFNMLNTKYYLVNDQQGNKSAQLNPGRLGPAWFVPSYRLVENADAEIQALNDFDPAAEAIIDQRFSDQLDGFTVTPDPTAQISLTKYINNHVVYDVKCSKPQLAVFSEVYYSGDGKGWNAYINGEKVKHFRTNYILRGMVLPAGEYQVEFKFEPVPFTAGVKISYASSAILILLVLFTLYRLFRSSNEKTLPTEEK